jgi:hypothetical protein
MTRSSGSHRVARYGALAAVLAGLFALLAVLAATGSAASTAAPVNTSPPTLAGTPQEGQTLTASPGTYSGTTPITYSYQYRRCDKTGGSCSDIGGSTTQTTYKLTSADVGNTVRVRVTASNSSGSTTATSVPSAVIQKASPAPAPPKNTSAPTLSGTPQEGQTLTANPGSYSGSTPITYQFQYRRCDKTGGSCSNSGGTTTQTIYKLTSADVGDTIRVNVTATNKDGATTATSAATGVIAAPPVTNGCPSGSGGIDVSKLSLPARLAIDGQQASPTVVRRSTSDLTLRFHVSACGGRPVMGALMYATAVPFEQFNVPPEASSGSDGWATLTLHKASRFPASSHEQLLAVFVRARKSGENLIGGISTRLLVSFPVNLRG